jgi:hypothetical protein
LKANVQSKVQSTLKTNVQSELHPFSDHDELFGNISQLPTTIPQIEPEDRRAKALPQPLPIASLD